MTDLEIRFWSKVDRESGASCWQWLGCTIHHGYGHFKINGKAVSAHRVAYELCKGPIPVGLHVLHRCDNPGCVNPEHLFVGTHDDNMEDKAVKGRVYRPRGEAHAMAKLTAAQVQEIRELRGFLLQREIAERFGVTRLHVCEIHNNKVWKEAA